MSSLYSSMLRGKHFMNTLTKNVDTFNNIDCSSYFFDIFCLLFGLRIYIYIVRILLSLIFL